MASNWERNKKDRADKLADIRKMKKNGSLVVRQMTAKERKEYGLPPLPKEDAADTAKPTRAKAKQKPKATARG